MQKQENTILFKTMNNNKRYTWKFVILGMVFLATVLASLFLGRYAVAFSDFWKIIWSKIPGTQVAVTWSTASEKVLLEIRLPRIACAILIGAALSLAGLCYQGMFRNPTVSPDILGASTGAGFGAALMILLGGSYAMITFSSFTFGIGAVLLAYMVSRFSRTSPTLALVLGGMVISALFSAGTSFIKLVADTQEQLPAITYWLMGSLNSIKLENLTFILLPMAVGMLPLFLVRWRLNLLTLEENTSKSVGINITVLRFLVIFCATLLTAASVSVSGMIGWVGLVIPHFCRMIFGFDYRRLVPATALFGAAFLLIVDDIARVVTTQDLPIGILTSFVGCPLFLYLLITGGGYRKEA